LRQAERTVEVHDDHFEPNTPDVDWLAVIGQRGWVVVTKDQRIRVNALERMALRAAGVRAFVLTSGNMTGPEMANVLVTKLSKIERLVRTASPPFIAKVTRTDVTLYP
jgi:hypothetical protein